MDFKLRQQGRAAMDFMVGMAAISGPLAAKWREDLKAGGLDPETLPDDLDERHEEMDRRLARSDAFAMSGLISQFQSTEHGRVAHASFAESRDVLEPRMRELEAKGPTTIETDPDYAIPAWFKDVWFHRTTGGWDGHPEQGFIHGELIHRHYVAKAYPGDIFAQRKRVLKELPRDDYKNIVEFGTSSGHYTLGLAETFPDAQITGFDISLPMLKQAQRVANEKGYKWRLIQRAGEESGLEAGQYDLVTSYIIYHEMPADAIRATMVEAFRLLEPGGQMLMSDVVPYAQQDKLSVWRADWLALHGGEPYWREAASLDWGQCARDAGFVDVAYRGVDGQPYPHIVMGTKPRG